MLLLSLAVALVVSSAAVAVYSAGSYPGGPVFMVPLLAVYSAASSRPRNRSVPWCRSRLWPWWSPACFSIDPVADRH
jgi:hypothetical protein